MFKIFKKWPQIPIILVVLFLLGGFQLFGLTFFSRETVKQMSTGVVEIINFHPSFDTKKEVTVSNGNYTRVQ